MSNWIFWIGLWVPLHQSNHLMKNQTQSQKHCGATPR